MEEQEGKTGAGNRTGVGADQRAPGPGFKDQDQDKDQDQGPGPGPRTSSIGPRTRTRKWQQESRARKDREQGKLEFEEMEPGGLVYVGVLEHPCPLPPPWPPPYRDRQQRGIGLSGISSSSPYR